MTELAVPPLPHQFLPPVPSLFVTSADIADGGRLPEGHCADIMGMTGENLSPHLRWSGAPADARSFAITCFDPDAPTGSGFWHWVLFDIPADVSELQRGAGSGEPGGLPKAAVQGRNDAGGLGYLGAAPPEGHGEHRYVFTVHALRVPSLGLDSSASPAYVGFNLTLNVIGRGSIIPVFGR